MKNLFILGVCLALLGGCTWSREKALQLSAENVKNVETAETMGVDLHRIWPYMSGAFAAVKGELNDTINKKVEALDEIYLDDGKPKDIASITQRDQGKGGTLWLWLIGSTATKSYRELAPSMFNLINLLGL